MSDKRYSCHSGNSKGFRSSARIWGQRPNKFLIIPHYWVSIKAGCDVHPKPSAKKLQRQKNNWKNLTPLYRQAHRTHYLHVFKINITSLQVRGLDSIVKDEIKWSRLCQGVFKRNWEAIKEVGLTHVLTRWNVNWNGPNHSVSRTLQKYLAPVTFLLSDTFSNQTCLAKTSFLTPAPIKILWIM